MADSLNDSEVVSYLFYSDVEIKDLPSDNNCFINDSDDDRDFLPNPSVSNCVHPIIINPSKSDSDVEDETSFSTPQRKRKITSKNKM